MSAVGNAASPGAAQLPVMILGSSSKWRVKIATAALHGRYQVVSMSPDIDEKAIRHPDPVELVRRIAAAKLRRILEMLSDDEGGHPKPAFVVTSDQVALFEGSVREKPCDEAEAEQFLMGYSKSHVETVAALVVHSTGLLPGTEVATAVGTWRTVTQFAEISVDIARRAIRNGSVMSCCGAFAVEDEVLAPLCSQVEGSIHDVQGLSVGLLESLLRDLRLP